MVTPSRLASILADEAMAAQVVPWACPLPFPPNPRYRLEELYATTPNAFVYRAVDEELSSSGFDATVAIKIFRSNHATLDEARYTRRVVHPNVVSVLDRGAVEEDVEYIVSEFVEGDTLLDWLPKLGLRDRLDVMVKIARAVQAAHTAGVYHLDLKPSNVLMTNDGDPRVADFGHARMVDQPEGPARGNVAFMAPEQFFREEGALTPPADIYALGGMLHFVLSDRLPNGETEDEVRRVHERAAARAKPSSIEPLNRVCERAMAHAPNDRYATAESFAYDVEGWLSNRPSAWMRLSALARFRLWILRNPVSTVGIAAALLLISVAASSVFLLQQQARSRERLAHQKAQSISEERIESLQARLRAQIRRYAEQLFGEPLPSIDGRLVFLHWLYGVALVDDEGNVASPHELITLLQNHAAVREQAGPLDLEGLLIESSLAFFLIWDNQPGEARERLMKIEPQLRAMLQPDDSYWEVYGILMKCLEVLESPPGSHEVAMSELRALVVPKGEDDPLFHLADRVEALMDVERQGDASQGD